MNSFADKTNNFIKSYFKPDYFFQHPALWIALFIAIFIACFAIHQMYVRQNVVNAILDSRRRALNAVKTKDQLFEDQFGAIKHKTVIYKLDRTILTSGIKTKFKFINAETYLFATVISVIVAVFVGLIISDIFLSIFLGAATAVAYHVALSSLSNRNYTKIEDQTSIFVSLLCNNSKESSDITLVMKRTLPNLSNPMYGLVKDFISNADTYGSTDVAFDIMKESIDNKQLKVIITNLKTCSHYEANYEDVLSQMVGQITAELSYREERKAVLLNGKITVASLSAIASLILVLIAKMLEIPITSIMFHTLPGRILCTIMGCIYLYVVVSLFAIDKD